MMSGEPLSKSVKRAEQVILKFDDFRRNECGRLAIEMGDFLKEVQDSAELEVIEAIQEWADALEKLGWSTPERRSRHDGS